MIPFHWYVLCIGILMCWHANDVMFWGYQAHFGTQKNYATGTLLPNYEKFLFSILNGCGIPTGGFSFLRTSGLVQFELTYVLIVENNRLAKHVLLLRCLALRIPLGTFSILPESFLQILKSYIDEGHVAESFTSIRYLYTCHFITRSNIRYLYESVLRIMNDIAGRNPQSDTDVPSLDNKRSEHLHGDSRHFE